MNGSNLYSIPGVMEALIELNPKTIIDIGAGNGKYGILCKEYIKGLERIDAIESSPKVNDTVWTYNTWVHANLQDHYWFQDYDVALLIAVMCNFTKEEGLEILKKVKQHCKNIVLTIEKEQHGGKTQWIPEDFPGAIVKDLPYEYLIIC